MRIWITKWTFKTTCMSTKLLSQFNMVITLCHLCCVPLQKVDVQSGSEEEEILQGKDDQTLVSTE